MKLPPAPESMSAAHVFPSTSKGLVCNGDTISTGHSSSVWFV